MADWPFPDPPNTAASTTREVLEKRGPILRVSHDEDDGCWQFIGPSGAREADGKVVGLQTILSLDPTVREVADLPLGWTAVRNSVGGAWVREASPPDSTER
jgi:hypothetical protein